MVINNSITQAEYGIYTPGGAGINWGKYRDNTMIDVLFPYLGGTDIGNNN